jgi:protein SCO1/2
MTPQQKKLVLPLIILALGFVSLVSVALYIVSQPADHRATANIGGPFQLTDQSGKRVTEASYKGGPMIVFFGFTHCPDVCPTTLFEMSEVLKRIPKDKKVAALFVTVDPERDTPALLKEYLSSFDPRISGLTGSREEIDAALKAYRVFAKKVPQENGEYSMDHSAIIYLMDKQGRFVNALNMQQPPEAVAREILRQM